MKGYKTTWGSGAYKDQMIDEDASVVEMLRDAGAVLIAKLTSGELAQGDQWFGGQTKNPWNLEQGSSGSSAGPASATAGGLRGVRHRDGDQRIDSESVGALRHQRIAADVRAREPLRRDGALLDAGPAGAAVPVRGGLRGGDERNRQARRARPERIRDSVQLECEAGYPQVAGGLSEGRVRRDARSCGEEAGRSRRWSRCSRWA